MRKILRNKCAICANYAIISLTYIIVWLLPIDCVLESDLWILGLGVTMSIFVPLSALEHRRTMNSSGYVILTDLLVFVFGLVLSFTYYSGFILAITIIETIVLLIIQFTVVFRD